jgi:hypothetical protein
VLGHAETLLAAMRHLITNESGAALHAGFLACWRRHRAKLDAVRRKHKSEQDFYAADLSRT